MFEHRAKLLLESAKLYFGIFASGAEVHGAAAVQCLFCQSFARN